jgi:eukaryotic-like serine/threonine-protein kinase
MGSAVMDQVDRLRVALAGRYEVDCEIGRGGMACVYRAHDRQHDRDVALKVLRPELAAALGIERFLREIRIEARLQHPHILPLYDSGTADGLLYYVMPYVEGETLRDRIKREKQLPVGEAVRIAREIAEALDYAHRHDVVHRDIKPSNILLSGPQAVVADFGIARAVSVADQEELTVTGLAVGTPEYMSPEQGSGDSNVDGRSDIYALGCVLYEMLAGEPPFTGRTAQNIVARHRHDPPPPLRVVRPTLSAEIAEVVEIALAKVPADRFATADQFAAALTRAVDAPPPIRAIGATRRRRQLILGGLAVAAVALWRLLPETEPLDPNRVVVFPLQGASSAPRDDASLALVASLNTTSSLNGIDGSKLAPPGADRSAAAMGRRARSENAAFYVEGTLLRADSLRLLLDLHDLRSGSVAHRLMTFPAAADGWAVGVRAALEILPVLIQTGRSAELPSLQGRSPAAMAEYFLGERSYRRAAFGDALEHFHRAVAIDSGFALAALRGTQAASWHRRPEEAAALVAVALANEQVLSPRQREFAHGVHAYLTGKADSAVQRFQNAIALDPNAAEPWMGLGETYRHLIPTASPLDSLAEQAFEQVRELDPTFAPVLFHLIEYAVRRGDRERAERLMEEYRRSSPDPDLLRTIELAYGCVQGTMPATQWRSAVRNNPARVFEAAQILSVGGLHQPRCAEPAWRALLDWDTTTGDLHSRYQFAALLGLHGLLVAEGRDADVRALLEGDTVFRASYRGQLYLLGALAGAGLEREANAFAESAHATYQSSPDNLSSIALWFLGSWIAHRGGAAEAEEMSERILRNAPSGSPRRDSLLAASLRARAALARGDSTDALRQLRALTPTATSHQDLIWDPWESLGGERLLLARLLLARGQAAGALEVASGFDSPVPVAYLMYLPASLSVRVQAAEQLGDTRLAEADRARLAALALQQRRGR